MSKTKTKSMIDTLKKALDSNMEIFFYDCFDGTTYDIEDVFIEDGACYIQSNVCGDDGSEENLEEDDHDSLMSFYDEDFVGGIDGFEDGFDDSYSGE